MSTSVCSYVLLGCLVDYDKLHPTHIIRHKHSHPTNPEDVFCPKCGAKILVEEIDHDIEIEGLEEIVGPDNKHYLGKVLAETCNNFDSLPVTVLSSDISDSRDVIDKLGVFFNETFGLYLIQEWI